MELTVHPRNRDAGAKGLRRSDRIPGVLYGFGIKNQPVECAKREFHKVFAQAGESTVIDLKIEGKSVPVLIHELSFDSVTGNYEHVDFFAPDMSKEVTANIPVRITGESPAVKDLGGILVRNRDALEVKCLPKDLPHDIEADISPLRNLHDVITVADIRIPAAVTVLHGRDEIVVSVQPPRMEEEEKPTEAAAGEAAAVEAPAEGEAPSEGKEKKEEGTKDSRKDSKKQ